MSNNINLDDIYQRTELVIGKDNLEALKKANVCICGIGGVGSYTLEALARIGIGNITIIDKDVIDITNINRQIIATVDNIGSAKVEMAKKRVNSINPSINVIPYEVFITQDNIKEYINKDFDYVIDAIDSVDSKVALIKYCYDNNIKIISSMGMANRLNPLNIKVSDIFKTNTDPLAKVVRKKLKENNIKKLKVVYSDEIPQRSNGGMLGSVSYVPSVAGLVIASEVVKVLIKGGE